VKMKRIRVDAVFYRRAIRASTPACIALISLFAGAVFHARTHPRTVEADSHHTFELMVYHTLPGKVPALESVFRDVSILQAKHGLHVVGYWIPTGNDPAWDNTFVYLVDHPSREAAEANWRALHADPAFQPYFTAAAPFIQQVKGDYKVDEVYMRPSGYSNMK
jgi:NIPSNAP